MENDAYTGWTKRYQATPNLRLFLVQLPDIPLSSRKILLALTRIQKAPLPPRQHPGGDWIRVNRRFEHELKQPIYTVYSLKPLTRRQITLHDIILPITTELECSLMAGFLSIHIRSAPYTSYEEIPQAIQDTTDKELKAALIGYTRYRLDFAPFLSYSSHDRNRPMAPNVSANPFLSWGIFQSLLSVKHELRGMKILPRLPKKTFGGRVATRIREELRQWQPDFEDIPETIADLERVYYVTGWRPEGEVEMRSAWKYNDLKPRVYYAQGPTVFNASMYVQPIFNKLLDAFEVCHRILRFTSPNTTLENATLYVYDYSSFTSSLSESTRFIFALADFLQDVEVECLDTREGYITMSIGDILRQYAESCNVNPEFDVHRLISSEGLCSIRFHNCGMLGVPGNLASCTILHAIHLMYVTGSMLSSRCVGDDGMAIVPGEDVEEFVDMVNNLGEVEKSKTEWWREEQEIVGQGSKESWHFTKRPIWRNFNSINRGELFIFPSLELILRLKDNYHRSSLAGSDFERKRKCLRQILRLWSTFSTFQHHRISEESTNFLLHYLRCCWVELGLPFNGGQVPFTLANGEEVFLRVPGLPRVVEELLVDPYVALGELLIGQTVMLPLLRQYDDICAGPVGCTFVSRSSGVLSVLVKIGVLEQVELLRESFSVEVGYSSLNSFMLEGNYDYSYLFRIREPLPFWLK